MKGQRRLRVVAGLACGVLVVAACGSGTSSMRTTSTVVSDPTTQEIRVFAPDSAGPWPIVIAFHGLNGSNQDMAELSRRVAEGGNLVFDPTWRTELDNPDGAVNAARDAECAYRYSRSIASDYRGDVEKPITFVGWSLGATLVLRQGLTEHVDASGQPMGCFADVPRADAIVAISGCYYEHEGVKYDFDTSNFGNKGALITLVAGEDDATCAPWQTQKAADALRAAGYQVDVVVLPSATHGDPVFHRDVDGKWTVIPGDPAGEKTVQVILDAIEAAVA